MLLTPNPMTMVVPYYWNNYDRCMACLHGNVTPYAIPSDMLNEAWGYTTNAPIQIPLAASVEPATVSRFCREGYEWVPVPDGVSAPTIMLLLAELYAYDKVKFAHLDPLLVAATTAWRDVEVVKKMTHGNLTLSNNSVTPDPTIAVVNEIATILKAATSAPSMVPYEDLVRLHLEYWGNSKLRAAFVNQRVPPYYAPKFDLFRLFPFVEMPAQLLAKIAFGIMDAIPEALIATTSIGDAKLEWVLARKATTGVPIRTMGTPARSASSPPTTTIQVWSIPPPRIELDGFATQEIWPLYLNEWKTGQGKINFRITTPAPVQKVLIEIVHQRGVIYSETHELGAFILPGVHPWSWDGFDKDGVFDTVLLKDGPIEARVTTVDFFGRVAVGHTHMTGQPGSIRWLDCRIDRKKKTIEVSAYLRFRNPSEVEISGFQLPLPSGLANLLSSGIQGLGGMSSSLMPLVPEADEIPEAASLDGLLGSAPLTDMVRPPSMSEMLNKGAANVSIHMPGIFDLPSDEWELYKNAIAYGIGYYWSREVHLDDQVWQLSTSSYERPVDNIQIFAMKGITEALGQIGITPGAGKTTLLPQGGLDRSLNLACFAEGLPILDMWEENATEWRRRSIGAHELGHSVLREAYDPFTSATHKGTTSVFGANPRYADPTAPDPDVMYYWNVPNQEHQIAVEDDARALVWLARIVFG